MARLVLATVLGSLLVAIGYIAGGLGWFTAGSRLSFPEILVVNPTPVPKPLQKYALDELRDYPFQTSKIQVKEKVSDEEGYSEYLFSFTTVGKTMSGLMTVPLPLPEDLNNQTTIVMVRGYVPPESYVSGVGTSPAARYFAKQGFITLAPDFFGFGTSDPEPMDEWEARFIKPIAVIELIKSLQSEGLTGEGMNFPATNKVGIWAHSNGGQIALSSLEVMEESIPTTLWAPVTAPFPYSVLYYGDEVADEGKQQRAWIAMFEKIYNAADFSLTQHLDLLAGPLQIHHGTNDDAALKTWSDEFVDKLDLENEKRGNQLELLISATQSAELDTKLSSSSALLKPIDYEYFVYPGADHNLRPVDNWNLAVSRDVLFFQRNLQ